MRVKKNYAVTSFMICTPYQKHHFNEVKMYGAGRGRAYIWDSHGREGKCTESWQKEQAWKTEALMAG